MFRFLTLYLLVTIVFLFCNINIQACNKSTNNQSRIFSRVRERILPNRHKSSNYSQSYSYSKSHQNYQTTQPKVQIQISNPTQKNYP